MKDSRDPRDLRAGTMAKWEFVRQELEANGIPVGIVSTFRDYEMQDYLYTQGRTRPGRIVTHVQAGGSFHNVRRAVDAWPLDKEGKLNAKFVDSKACIPLMAELGRVGKLFGFQWGGDWANPDRPHLQDGLCERCGTIAVSARHFNENGRCIIGG